MSPGMAQSEPGGPGPVALNFHRGKSCDDRGRAPLSGCRRVAVFGGDRQRSARELGGLEHVELFGSSGQTGQGELRRLVAAIRAGRIARVYLVLRWAGHSEVRAIRRLCRERGIRCEVFRSFGAVRRALRR